MPDQTDPKPASKTWKTVGAVVLALVLLWFVIVPVLRNVFQGL
jgi:flagellar biosynthesis/type III secretory pathway M-ring protein FliF/YscJ